MEAHRSFLQPLPLSYLLMSHCLDIQAGPHDGDRGRDMSTGWGKRRDCLHYTAALSTCRRVWSSPVQPQSSMLVSVLLKDKLLPLTQQREFYTGSHWKGGRVLKKQTEAEVMVVEVAFILGPDSKGRDDVRHPGAWGEGPQDLCWDLQGMTLPTLRLNL